MPALKPSLVEWKHVGHRLAVPILLDLETFLSGMETAGGREGCRRQSDLETFLSGMETAVASFSISAIARNLETFLSGMETRQHAEAGPGSVAP